MLDVIKRLTVLAFCFGAANGLAQGVAQPDSLLQTPNVVGGIYDRPYIDRIAGSIAIGG